MGGILGIGASSAKTDRGNQLAATQGLWNVFNYGLPMGERTEASGQQTLDTARDYFTRLLRAGRTETAATSAPAVNARLASEDAQRRQEASTGTARMGGTVEANREAGTRTSGDIANIINENLVGGRREAAQGLERVAGEKLSSASNLLGLGTRGVEDILINATESRPVSQRIHDEAAAGYGAALGQVLSAFFG